MLLPSVQSLLVISEAQTAVDSAENALLSRDIDLKARLEKYATLAVDWKRADEAWKIYEPLPQSPEEAVTWKKFEPAWQAWKKDHQAYVALSQEYDKTVEAQQKGTEGYAKMDNQAMKVNPVSFAKAKALLDQIVEIYRAKSDNAQATYSKVDLLTIHSLLTIKEAQTRIDGAENALLDRSGDLAERLAIYGDFAAAWKVACRDQFIGWSPQQRQRGLPQIANQQRFLILPWVRVPSLASHLLGLSVRRLSADWQQRYGHPVGLAETFVEDARFAGTAYQAAGWLRLGQTTGRTRQDRDRTLQVPIKSVWVKPLQANFRDPLCLL